jgi:hypothetical protein
MFFVREDFADASQVVAIAERTRLQSALYVRYRRSLLQVSCIEVSLVMQPKTYCNARFYRRSRRVELRLE